MIQKQNDLFCRFPVPSGTTALLLSVLFMAQLTPLSNQNSSATGQEVLLPTAQEARTQLSGMHSTWAWRKINDFAHKKKWIKWPQIDNKLNADFEEVSDGNKYWLTSYCVPFLDDSELPVETQIHLISASVRQRGLWGLELISTACMCTRTFACVKRMSKFSIYPSGNARVGSNFPILSPRFSEFVTSRFSQPWKFSCNQELRAERKSVRGLKAPLISLTSCLGTLWVCFQERDSVLFLYGLQWPSLEACLARERAWETGAAKMRLARSFWEGWELPCFYFVFLFPN